MIDEGSQEDYDDQIGVRIFLERIEGLAQRDAAAKKANLKFMRELQIKKIRSGYAGPTEEELKNGKSYVWGRVEDTGGNAMEAITVGPNGYELTAHSALLIAQRVLSGKFTPGFMTPAKAYGANFILEVPCTDLRDVSPS